MKQIAEAKQLDDLNTDCIDLSTVKAPFLRQSYSQYPLERFYFRDIEFRVKTNRNLRKLKLVIDTSGYVLMKTNPTYRWVDIREMIRGHYNWCKEHLESMTSSYDQVSFHCQKKRTFRTNDLVYVWGQPYLILVVEDEPHNSIGITRPKQLIPTLVPKGSSRFGAKAAKLCANGYINTNALKAMPIFNQGRLIMPKQSLFDDINAFEYDRTKYGGSNSDEVASMRHIHPKLAHDTALRDRAPNTGNYYLDAFACMMQLTQDNLLSRKQFFGSRMLSATERTVLENVIRRFTDLISPEHYEPEIINDITGRCEMASSSCILTVLKGSIGHKTGVYAFDPLQPHNNFKATDDPKQTPKHSSSSLQADKDAHASEHVNDANHEAKVNYDLYENFIKLEDVRTDQPPVSILQAHSQAALDEVAKARSLHIKHKKMPTFLFYPEYKDYISMCRKDLIMELAEQLAFYKSGRLHGLIKTATIKHQDANALAEQELTRTALTQSASPVDDFPLALKDLELTFVTTDGKEVDPSTAIIAYLPDTPHTANLMYSMSQSVALGQANETYVAKIAGDILYRRRNAPRDRYFHKTLVKPGILRIVVKDKNNTDNVKDMIEKFIQNEMYKVSAKFLDCIHPFYISVYNHTARHYQLKPIEWVGKLHIMRMRPLGQCRTRRGQTPEIRLNPHLSMYPFNLTAAVIMHEICHLNMYNHSKVFYFMLSNLSPDADNVADSMFSINIKDIA